MQFRTQNVAFYLILFIYASLISFLQLSLSYAQVSGGVKGFARLSPTIFLIWSRETPVSLAQIRYSHSLHSPSNIVFIILFSPRYKIQYDLLSTFDVDFIENCRHSTVGIVIARTLQIFFWYLLIGNKIKFLMLSSLIFFNASFGI